MKMGMIADLFALEAITVLLLKNFGENGSDRGLSINSNSMYAALSGFF
jgi:hypothetical protein